MADADKVFWAVMLLIAIVLMAYFIADLMSKDAEEERKKNAIMTLQGTLASGPFKIITTDNGRQWFYYELTSDQKGYIIGEAVSEEDLVDIFGYAGRQRQLTT